VGVIRICSNRWDYSFSTKLLHTLDPSKPIVDSKVLKLLEMPLPLRKDMKLLLDHYAKLETAINALLETSDITQLLREFDKELPELANISNVKKLDFILWQLN